jgi:hypothetical protein
MLIKGSTLNMEIMRVLRVFLTTPRPIDRYAPLTQLYSLAPRAGA